MLAAVRRDWRFSLWSCVASQYRRGRDFEYAVRDDLRACGYEVVRSAGSKTKIDLVGIAPGELLLVQCKLPGSAISGAEWNLLFWTAQLLDCAKAIVATKVPGQAAPEYQRITCSALSRTRRKVGIHYETWRPDGARP